MSEYIKKSEVLSEIIDANMHDCFANYDSYSKFYDKIKAMPTIDNADNWISAKNKKPKSVDYVLVVYEKLIIGVGFIFEMGTLRFDGLSWWDSNGEKTDDDDVLYWQPLPKLPKELRDK